VAWVGRERVAVSLEMGEGYLNIVDHRVKQLFTISRRSSMCFQSFFFGGFPCGIISRCGSSACVCCFHSHLLPCRHVLTSRKLLGAGECNLAFADFVMKKAAHASSTHYPILLKDNASQGEEEEAILAGCLLLQKSLLYWFKSTNTDAKVMDSSIFLSSPQQDRRLGNKGRARTAHYSLTYADIC
jgi:hypothetical protein